MRAGWDVGGAHLKFALADDSGRVLAVKQLSCPLWQGLGRLSEALGHVLYAADSLPEATTHALTMTGELADVFSDRAEGVRAIVGVMQQALPAGSLRVYAADAGLLAPRTALERVEQVASANWLATACVVAQRRPHALLVDIGSTTSDLVPLGQGRLATTARTDADRLRSGELVYTGVVRTPVMALARQAPLDGHWHGLAAELFATTADIYRLTGELSEDADLMPTADGRAKSPRHSAARLARMLGLDAGSRPEVAWQELARFLSGCQLRLLSDALGCVRSKVPGTLASVVGAGCGGFLARRLAVEQGLPYVDFAGLLGVPASLSGLAACCAPAVALSQPEAAALP